MRVRLHKGRMISHPFLVTTFKSLLGNFWAALLSDILEPNRPVSTQTVTLSVLHELRLIHTYRKPENILLVPNN